jgi:hypothetical protein
LTAPTGIAVPANACSATRSESVSIVAATSAEVGRSTAPERVRRRATCGAASATNAIGPVTTVTVAVGPTLLTALSTSWSVRVSVCFVHVGMRWIHRPRQMSAAAAR